MSKAASIRDVNFSFKGETTQTTPFEAFEQVHLGGTNTEVAPNSGRVILKLKEGSGRNGKLYLDGIDDVYNEKTKKKERVRLLRGVDTIWQKEQKDIDEKYVSKNRRSLEFVKGTCILEATDIAGIEFSEVSNCSLDNPHAITGKKHKFFKWNPLAQEKAALEKEMFEYEVMQLAMSQPIEKVRKHLVFLGGASLYDEYGNPRSEQGIRTLYLRRAKEIPKRFKETLDSKEVEVKWLISKAIQDAIIDLGGAGGRVKWANGGGDICIVPKGVAPHEYLLQYALLPTEEGKTFLERLQKTV